MDFLLPIWNPYIVHPLEQMLRLIAEPLTKVMAPGLAGGLAIILFTILLRVLLLPLSLIQIRSQRHQMAIQPELKELQRRFKGDREGLAKAQMQLYKDRGVNPAAGCIPLLIQLPILFGMYSAMNQLSTMGMTLDQVTTNNLQSTQLVYSADRDEQPLPYNQFELVRMQVVPNGPTTPRSSRFNVSFAGCRCQTTCRRSRSRPTRQQHQSTEHAVGFGVDLFRAAWSAGRSIDRWFSHAAAVLESGSMRGTNADAAFTSLFDPRKSTSRR